GDRLLGRLVLGGRQVQLRRFLGGGRRGLRRLLGGLRRVLGHLLRGFLGFGGLLLFLLRLDHLLLLGGVRLQRLDLFEQRLRLGRTSARVEAGGVELVRDLRL